MTILAPNGPDTSTHEPLTSYGLPGADIQALLHAPPIDVHVLLEQSLGKPSFAVSLITAFASSGQQRLNQMEHQLAQANFDELAGSAHALKGVTGVIAAIKLEEISSSLEAASRDADVAHVRALLAEVCQEMQRVLDYIPILCVVAEQQV